MTRQSTNKYYISHYLKKPRKIPLKNFSDRIEMLNSYIPYLPGLINSPKGANMKKAMALDEPELTQLLLQLVPQCQQDQYELIKGTIPISLRLTLDTLETKRWMFKFPGKPRKWQNPGMKREKGKSLLKTMVLLQRRNVPPGIVPSVLNTGGA